MKTERAKFVLATWGLIYKKIVTTKLRQNVWHLILISCRTTTSSTHAVIISIFH